MQEIGCEHAEVRPRCRQCDKCSVCCPQRHNIERQEEVVEALWDFAYNLQVRPAEGGIVARAAEGERHHGVAVGLDHVGTGLAKIMRAFNYGVTPIQ
jgi:hypothetical protein